MGLVVKLVQKLGLIAKILPALFKAAADGQLGIPVRRVYWTVAGYKTLIGCCIWLAAEGLAIFYGAGQCPDCAVWLPYVKGIGEFLVAVGLCDAGVRQTPPVEPTSVRVLSKVAVEPKA